MTTTNVLGKWPSIVLTTLIMSLTGVPGRETPKCPFQGNQSYNPYYLVRDLLNKDKLEYLIHFGYLLTQNITFIEETFYMVLTHKEV